MRVRMHNTHPGLFMSLKDLRVFRDIKRSAGAPLRTEGMGSRSPLADFVLSLESAPHFPVMEKVLREDVGNVKGMFCCFPFGLRYNEDKWIGQ